MNALSHQGLDPFRWNNPIPDKKRHSIPHNKEKLLAPYRNSATAIILEPVLQGAGGMKVYSQDFLSRINVWANENNVHIIADEIMTGIGRTEKMLACEHVKTITQSFMMFWCN